MNKALVNGLFLYITLFSPKTRQCFTVLPFTHSHADGGDLQCSHSCPDRGEAANQLVPQGLSQKPTAFRH